MQVEQVKVVLECRKEEVLPDTNTYERVVEGVQEERVRLIQTYWIRELQPTRRQGSVQGTPSTRLYPPVNHPPTPPP